MIDINTIISQALTAAVEQATAPLLERIAALEAQSTNRYERLRVLVGALTDRVADLESQSAALLNRVAALKTTEVQIDKDDLLAHLDNQEWFWNKIRHFTDGAVEQAIENHTDCWDHNDFVTEDKLDDYVKTEDFDSEVRDAVRDIMEGATVSIRI